MIEVRIKRVMGEVLGIEADSVDGKSSPETIAEWDSISHMSLLLALEQEFGVTFDDKDLPELTSFVAIRAALARLEAHACS